MVVSASGSFFLPGMATGAILILTCENCSGNDLPEVFIYIKFNFLSKKTGLLLHDEKSGIEPRLGNH